MISNEAIENVKESGIYESKEFIFWADDGTEFNPIVTAEHTTCGLRFPFDYNEIDKGVKCLSCHKTEYSKPQKAIKDTLERLQVEYIPEYHVIENEGSNNHLRANFYLPRYDAYIEYLGAHHFKDGLDRIKQEWRYDPYSLADIQRRDQLKVNHWQETGSRFIRISYQEVRNIPQIVESFIQEL